MVKIKNIAMALLTALSVGSVSALSTSNASAEGNTRPAIMLQVSPVKQKISLEPGASYVGTFKVMNVGTQPFDYKVSATPYSVTNDNYDPDYSNVKTYSQMADWITFDTKTASGTLASDTSIDVVYTVNVPQDVPAGGQYAALMAETDAGNASDANIKTVHRVGMILYATVPGETRSGKGTGEIISNNVGSFYFEPPISFTSTVKNNGNVEQTATYTINVWPLFSNEAVYSNADEPKQLAILPETSRYYSDSWEGSPQLGIFKVSQVIEFAGETNTNERIVIICPIWLIILIIAFIAFGIYWIVSRIRSRKAEGEK